MSDQQQPKCFVVFSQYLMSHALRCLPGLFPACRPVQPFPHTSFEHEAFFLRKHFGHLGNGGSAYVLGDMFNGLQWHVYVADANGALYEDALHPLAKPTHKLEVCMTDLGKQEARAFFRDPAKSAAQVRSRVLPASGL